MLWGSPGWQRAAGALAPPTQQEIERLYQSLNPLALRRQIDAELERLWALAAPDPHRAGATAEPPEIAE